MTDMSDLPDADESIDMEYRRIIQLLPDDNRSILRATDNPSFPNHIIRRRLAFWALVDIWDTHMNADAGEAPLFQETIGIYDPKDPDWTNAYNPDPNTFVAYIPIDDEPSVGHIDLASRLYGRMIGNKT